MPPSSDETTPLLTDGSSLEEQRESKAAATPIPMAQLAALCVARLTDPIAYCQIFPYINALLVSLHVTDDVSKIGFYSGLVESTFAVTQSLTCYYWATLSDKVGRRPIVLIGSTGLAISILLFGFATSLTQIIAVRALAGFFGGNLAVYHSILAEITDISNQAVAYPLYSFTWPLGATLGPLLGSQLSNLGTKYPAYWGYDFIIERPYLMPNVATSLVVVTGVFLAYLFLEETLPSKRPGFCVHGTSSSGQSTSDSLGVGELLAIPMIRILACAGFMLALISGAFDVVFVLFCYTPIARGGLSFSVDEIGYALALSSIILALLQLFVMPHLLRLFRPVVLLHFTMWMWLVPFALMPWIHIIAKNGLAAGTGSQDPENYVRMWIAVAIMLSTSRIGALGFAANMLLVKDQAPSPSSLGALNGMIQVIMGLSRCFSPVFVSSIYALSSHSQGPFPQWVLVMFVLCGAGGWISRKLLVLERQK
ncbi:unnamed protein product [Mycena citricolor]|uniref:Major facilitator superfamily (MFS) profile domain-containing protein n=1 Tax=Mycena citricolor TaxID=2018698 RepID=A0AAD2K5A2_9AGAR|nr:unnamed protein product [Mycena citricolor]